MGELQKEISILSGTDDDFVVQYIGAYINKEEDKIWIAMELCEAGSVNDLIHICDVFLEEEAIKHVVASVLHGLKYLHANNMIHRDIKAGNILLTMKGQAKLGDFGVSATLGANQSKRKTVIGTPFWMAPEVISESSYDGKADIWSLGITIIEMAQKEPPFSNIHPMRAIFMIPSRPPPKLQGRSDGGEWSPQMHDFLARCLQKNPDMRPTAKELCEDEWVADVVNELEAADPPGASEVLRELVEEHIADIDETRKFEASDRDSSSNSASVAKGSRGNTAMLSAKNTGNMGGGVTGTVHIAADGFGTIVDSGSGNNTAIYRRESNNTLKQSTETAMEPPPFMRYFQSTSKSMRRKTAARKSKHVTMKESAEDDWVIPSTSQEGINLHSRLKNLNMQFQRDVVELREAYEKRRRDLIAAASPSAAG